MGFFDKTPRLTYDRLLVLPPNAKCPAAFSPDIDLDVTSRSDDPLGQSLSPFLLGPVLVENTLWSHSVENAWQFSKVYPEHIDTNGNPSEEWYSWREAGFQRVDAIRYPMGKGAKPLYSVVSGIKMGYAEAREEFYQPMYLLVARATEAWAHLHAAYQGGARILLRDFDAYDHVAEQVPLEEGLRCADRKFGHGMMLALALQRGLQPS